MSYMITVYGDATDIDSIKDINSLEEAKKILGQKVEEWCEENDVDIDETDYSDRDQYFNYGIEGRGVCIYEIHEVPDFENEIEELIWRAKLETEYAEYAADNYCWSLMDNCVSDYTFSAREYLDKALKLIK